MKCFTLPISIAMFLINASSFAANSGISGVLTDRLGRPLQGASISLIKTGYSTKSDASGNWKLAPIPTRLSPDNKYLQAQWIGKILHIDLPEASSVKIEGFDMSGALIKRISTAFTASGKYDINVGLPENRVFILKVTINKKTYVMKKGKVESLSNYAMPNSGSRMMALSVDTIQVQHKNFVAKISVSNIDTSGFIIRIDTTTYFKWNSNVVYDGLYDSRDGQYYKTVKIGSQRWMAENLTFKVDSSWWYDNDSVTGESSGRTYQWTSAMNVSDTCNAHSCNNVLISKQGVCPTGWHIPSDSEWTTLTTAVEAAQGANLGGYALKSSDHWSSYGTTSGNGIDAYGFRALPAGSGGGAAGFSGSYSYNTMFWSATGVGIVGTGYTGGNIYGAKYRMLSNKGKTITVGSNAYTFGYYIRCTADN